MRQSHQLVALLLFAAMPGRAISALTDLGTVPMANASDTVVKPNVMFILDDSGSMAWEYLPDSVNNNNSKFCYRNNAYNGVYYSPDITYTLPVDATGASFPNASFIAASQDGFTVGATTTNLATGFQTGNDAAGGPAYYYSYKVTNTPSTPVEGTCYADSSYTKVTISPPTATLTISGSTSTSVTNLTVNGQRITAGTAAATTNSGTLATRVAAQINLCTTAISGSCTTTGYSATRSGSVVTIAGPVGAAGITPVVTKSGTMTITPTAFTAGSNTAQMQNFANWYSYYRNRMLMMKTASGQAFQQLDNRFRVGFITINPSTNTSNPVSASNPVAANRYLAISDFDSPQKSTWYSRLYNMQGTVMGTPLRPALARVGRYFGGKHDGVNSGMTDDPVQYSCQQNFAILTTDGFWNTMNDASNPVGLDGVTAIGNQDNLDQTTAPIYSSRATGTYDGAVAGATNTLADVAMYYYKTDLRPAGSTNLSGSDVSADNVPVSDKDFAAHQHMTTFTLGIVSGQLSYLANYETATSGAFYDIRQGTANWPLPVSNTLTALDDLWHAAVNGRGTYYNARNPASLAEGLVGTLNDIMARLGTGASSAVSNPRLPPSGGYYYGTSYRTGSWTGDLQARAADPATGNESTTVSWSAQPLLDGRVLATSDSRTIYTFDGTAANKLKSFLWANLTTGEQAHFSGKCSLWSQCTVAAMPSATMVVANDGQHLVNYLRGQFQHEIRGSNTVQAFRNRDHALGDFVNAKPVYVKAPEWNYADNVTPTYSTFKNNNASRQAMIYAAANDGMLHAFNADTGAELWAYLPKMTMPNLYLLAEKNYSITHRYFVDGSPAVMDVFDATQSSWRTLLVGGLGGGGRGWYALDVTDPAAPKALWEICADSTLCTNFDADMGYSYGDPVITKRASDGRWVVILSSGYNNASTGTGRGYLYVLDALSGSVLSKIDTNSGSTATPSGLSKISAWVDNSDTDNTTKWVYGGDLNGDVWRFDLTTSPPSMMQIAALRDAAGAGQPITTQPELALFNGARILLFGTGRYLGLSDLSNTQQQSVYAFRDTSGNLGNLRIRNDMVVKTLTQPTATTRDVSTNPVDWGQNSGWYVDLNPGNASPGERISIDPLLVNGILQVTSNVPVSSACTTGGTGWSYLFDFSTGGAPVALGGAAMGQKNSSSVFVGASAILLPDGRVVFILRDATGASSQVTPPNPTTPTGRRVSWRELTP